MWSIYDSLLLATGVITAVIAVLPLAEVKAKTRVAAALIGGALIVLSLVLGSLRSFRYPSVVYIAPVLALLALGAAIADALHKRKGDALQFHERATTAQLPAPSPVSDAAQTGAYTSEGSPVEPVATAPQPAVLTDDEPPRTEREDAWIEANDPGTPAARLAEIVGRYPEFGAAVRGHGNCYPELRAWIDELTVQQS